MQSTAQARASVRVEFLKTYLMARKTASQAPKFQEAAIMGV
jgi:hypothetical protein